MVKKRNTKIASLAYSDSENEDDEGGESHSVEEGEIDDEDEDAEEGAITDGSGSMASRGGGTGENYHPNSDDSNGNANAERAEAELLFFEDVYGDQDLTIADFHRSLYGKAASGLAIPPPTKRRCPEDLQRRIELYYEKVRHGSDLNKSIQMRKDLRNPSIYEKMISYCSINEMATNYPEELYDATPFLGDASYYEELSRLQKEEMERRVASNSAATASSTTSKVSESSSSRVAQSTSAVEKKSKWDSGPPAGNSAAAAVAVALSKVNRLAKANSKPTVVTAFGTINKRK